ncbi:unnamed protein product [Durusdinium trenchii]|uniref:Secreted protein n=1 Tax=Durusdinium trenchii TaxID=1381693 RepID=A0ABP0LQU9_9DINO
MNTHFLCLLAIAAAQPSSPLSPEQLKPLTSFRQQHRRLVDGRLCAAAFVQDEQVFTGCSDVALSEICVPCALGTCCVSTRSGTKPEGS